MEKKLAIKEDNGYIISIMNEIDNTTTTEPQAQETPVLQRKRGRPKMDVSWPEVTFTFNSLVDENKALSSSSLRKKMRVELVGGGLVKVGTLKTAFGRPQNIYRKP